MTQEEKNKKNKLALGAMVTIIGAGCIVIGAVLGFYDVPNNVGKAFWLCLGGTALTFLGNYLRNGYIKFFNE